MKYLLYLFLLVSSLGQSFAQVTVLGQGSCLGSCQFDPAVVTVTTTSLAGGTVGTVYSQPLAALGGSGSYTFSVSAGLPPGLTIFGATVAGTPTTPGTYSFSITATDSNGLVSGPQPLSIVIVSGVALTINNTIFPNFPFSKPYGQPINVSGGTGSGYVCSVAAGGTGLPSGVTVNTNCTIGLQASSVGGTIGNTYTYKLHVTDSGAGSFTSPTLYSNLVVQPCGPPNFGCSIALVNDNCVLQIPGGGASSPCGHPTNASVPNLNNGNADCTPGTNCEGVSATDPQFNNVLLTRCTDGSLNGTISAAPFLNRPYVTGLGGSGDANGFTTDSSMLAIFDSGSRFIIETIDTTAHTCYPIYNGSSLFLPGAGEFSSKTKGRYFSFFPGDGGLVNAFDISCTGPGHIGVVCTGLTSSTVKADFGTVFPGVTATPWAPSTSYAYGQYVTAYLTNSQHTAISAATCSAGTATYTLSPGQTALKAGMKFNATGLSTFNGTALLIATANAPGTIITAVTGCATGTATGPGTFTQGSDVLFQNVVSGSHTSGTGTPTWAPATFSLTTDSGITWIAVGTANFGQGGGWTTIGGVAVDETVISGGFSNNNFDTTAKGALNVTMSGTQNSGFLVYSYDVTADLYSEWNMGSGIAKTFACTVSSGPQCTRGVSGITVLGQINPTSTTPCTNVSPFGANTCQMYLHNIKILKGGAYSAITPEFCTSKASGPGNCPTGGKYYWQKSTSTVNMAFTTNGGHETERFTFGANFPGTSANIAVIRTATAANTVAPLWVNTNINGLDGHWGWYYLNGSTSDATTTPIGGCTDNTTDFPYTSSFQSECLVVSTCGVTGSVTSPTCVTSPTPELQHNQVSRQAHHYSTGTGGAVFNGQFAISDFSQDGKILAVSTDWACQFGQTDGGTGLCGFPWSPSFAYTGSSLIEPTSTATFVTTNPGNFVYKASGVCTSGTTQPKPFNQTVGGTTTDGTCTWTNQGAGKQRVDVVLIWTQ